MEPHGDPQWRGDASICRAEFVDGLTSDQFRHLFRSARGADYSELAAAARELWTDARRPRGHEQRKRVTRPEADLARLRKRFATVATIDFFDAPEAAIARQAIDMLESELEPNHVTPDFDASTPASRAEYIGRTWVTRSNVFVDRIASAWLVRRFIDPGARFRFVRDEQYRPTRGEIRFDMFEGEFTHEGDRCTFEVLVQRLTHR